MDGLLLTQAEEFIVAMNTAGFDMSTPSKVRHFAMLSENEDILGIAAFDDAVLDSAIKSGAQKTPKHFVVPKQDVDVGAPLSAMPPEEAVKYMKDMKTLRDEQKSELAKTTETVGKFKRLFRPEIQRFYMRDNYGKILDTVAKRSPDMAKFMLPLGTTLSTKVKGQLNLPYGATVDAGQFVYASNKYMPPGGSSVMERGGMVVGEDARSKTILISLMPMSGNEPKADVIAVRSILPGEEQGHNAYVLIVSGHGVLNKLPPEAEGQIAQLGPTLGQWHEK
jgi:hypothetical protein